MAGTFMLHKKERQTNRKKDRTQKGRKTERQKKKRAKLKLITNYSTADQKLANHGRRNYLSNVVIKKT